MEDRVERNVVAVPCECGGYCDRVECTLEEHREYGCGRDRLGYECCARAFVCRICKRRHVATAEAPDMD